jgi:hypothetical protein
LDDTFRNYLAEAGAKPVPLADMSVLLSGVAGLRITADAVMDLWQRDDGASAGQRGAARVQILDATAAVGRWYQNLATSLIEQGDLPEPVPHDDAADSRLIDTLRRDLTGADGAANATAIRMIWTADHVDAARRLQNAIIAPALEANVRQSQGLVAQALPGWLMRTWLDRRAVPEHEKARLPTGGGSRA